MDSEEYVGRRIRFILKGGRSRLTAKIRKKGGVIGITLNGTFTRISNVHFHWIELLPA